MAQSKRTRKSQRQHQPEHHRSSAEPHHEEHAPDAQPGNAHASTSCHLPAVVANGHDAQGGSKSSALALIPSPSAAATSPAAKRGLPSAAKAILISLCLTAVVVLSLGALKPNRYDMQVGPAAVTTPPVTALAETSEKTAPPPKMKVAAKRPPHVTPSASKPETDKKLVQAHTRHAPQPLADGTQKKPAASVAKSQHKQPEGQPLLAQNSAQAGQLTGMQNRYAQCQELGSFFRREQCKWQACNGKWGQDGCPSYANDNRDIN